MYNTNLKIIEQLIELQRSSIKLYLYYTLGILSLGIILVICGRLLFSGSNNDTIKTIMTSGGAIISSFSGFSFKEFLNKKENINLYSTFQKTIEMYKENTTKQEQFETTLQNYLFK